MMRPAAISRHNSIGALRLFLAVLVVYTHCFYLGGFGREWLLDWSRGLNFAGNFAVQSFFALSGWLVATSWRRQPSLRSFLWHRGLRLLPALWVCLLVTAFVFAPLVWWFTAERPTFLQLDPSAAGYVWRNLFLPRTQIAIGPLPLQVPHPGDWNGSLWTLFYEGACYLMVAVLGLAGLLSRWRIAGTVLVGCFLALHAVLVITEYQGGLVRFFDTPGKLLTLHFLAGAAWAAWPEAVARVQLLGWAGITLPVLLFLSWRFAAQVWLSPLLLPPAVLWLGGLGLLAELENRIGGDYSYGIYLYGYPVQQVLAFFEFNRFGFVPYLLASLLLALACAGLSWRWIEKPALGFKSWFDPRATPA